MHKIINDHGVKNDNDNEYQLINLIISCEPNIKCISCLTHEFFIKCYSKFNYLNG